MPQMPQAHHNPFISSDALPEPSEGIEILVEMAKRGELDPWDVDLVAVADAYLAYVSSLEQAPQEPASAAVEEAMRLSGDEQTLKHPGIISEAEQSRLRLTGKTLLYLAVLLRMKSDLLSGIDPFAPSLEDADFGDLLELDEDALAQQAALAASMTARLKARYGSLDQVLERRPSAKQTRIRQVTLADLIQELKKFEALEQERSSHRRVQAVERRRHRSGMQDYSQLTTEDITHLAHDEFQEEQVEDVLAVLEAHLPRPDADDEPPESPARMSLTDVEDLTGLPRVSCFLSMLFLEVRNQLEMVQDDFYSDEIYIHWRSPSPLEVDSSTI